jgi:hypothetical protein
MSRRTSHDPRAVLTKSACSRFSGVSLRRLRSPKKEEKGVLSSCDIDARKFDLIFVALRASSCWQEREAISSASSRRGWR